MEMTTIEAYTEHACHVPYVQEMEADEREEQCLSTRVQNQLIRAATREAMALLRMDRHGK